MKFLQKLRITHKISFLMAGLVFGFITIGVTYFIQIQVSDNARNLERNAMLFQQRVFDLQRTLSTLPTETQYSVLSNRERAQIATLRADIEVLRDIEGTVSAHGVLANIDSILVDWQAGAAPSIQSLDNEISGLSEVADRQLHQASESASEIAQKAQAAVTAIIFLVAMGTAIGIYFIYKSIVFPMAHMQNVISRINRGKTKARVKILSEDELADLGRAFNALFDERIQQLESNAHENEQLNNSIIGLIQALGAIAKKDLRIKVPVSADITGTVSDAVNMLTQETANTLSEVKGVSREVDEVSQSLEAQSQRVMQFAESERMQIAATAKALRVLASAMNEVAQKAETADAAAGSAIEKTRSARQSVAETFHSIRDIRETIAETEKRTKRLGDRSQEISGIVNLINTIAERTHILALNASMHAASAGEAGKGFAVVAEEVQRLAESARQSTDEISSMVNNMRVETADTVHIMNTLISQVAAGSKLAEQADQVMDETEHATKDLTEVVNAIAKAAVEQAGVANRVNDRAVIIRNFSDKTEGQLKDQKALTETLRRCAEILVDRVNTFKLPQDEKPTQETATPPTPLRSAV